MEDVDEVVKTNGSIDCDDEYSETDFDSEEDQGNSPKRIKIESHDDDEDD